MTIELVRKPATSNNGGEIDSGVVSSSGNWTLGPTSGSPHQIIQGGSNGNGTQAQHVLEIKSTNASGVGPQGAVVFTDAAGDSVGTISINASANTTAYNTSSDARLKHLPESFDGLSLIANMLPRKYERISNPEVKEIGFYAQELYEVYPQAVTEGSEDARTSPWSIDYAKLTPVLVKAIQELNQKFEDYKSAHP